MIVTAASMVLFTAILVMGSQAVTYAFGLAQPLPEWAQYVWVVALCIGFLSGYIALRGFKNQPRADIGISYAILAAGTIANIGLGISMWS